MTSPIDAAKAVTAGQIVMPDPRDINYNEMDTDTHEGYQNALRSALSSLEQRYAQPNLWKVAAAFFKPQLGGFAASLGSANEAMGENLELQRANQLPIAQLRAQLASQQIGAKQNEKAAQIYKEFVDGGGSPEEYGDLSERLNAVAPNAPVTKSVMARIGTNQKQQELESTRMTNAINQIKLLRETNNDVPPELIQYVNEGLARQTRNSDKSGSDKRKPPPPQAAVNPAVDDGGATTAPVISQNSIVNNAPVTAANLPIIGKPRPDAAAPPAAALPAADSNALPIPDLKPPPLQEKPVVPESGRLMARIESMPDVTSIYNNPKIQNPKAEAMRVGTLAQEYQTAMQNYYDAAATNNPERAKAAGIEMNALTREFRRVGVEPPVMATPNGKLNAPPQAAAKPAAPAAESTEPFPILHQYPSPEKMRNKSTDVVRQMEKAAESRAAGREKVASAVVDSLAPYGNPSLYKPYVQSLIKGEKLIEEDPKMAAKVHNILGTGTTWSQILTAIQAGGTVNVSGGLMNGTFGINLPAKAWAFAKLDEKEAAYANRMATEYAKQALYEARLQGVNVSNMPVAQFNAVLTAHPNMDQRWDAALNGMKDRKIDAQYKNLLFGAIQNDLKRVPEAELAPNASVLQHSTRYKTIQSAWDHEKKELEKDFKKQSKPR